MQLGCRTICGGLARANMRPCADMHDGDRAHDRPRDTSGDAPGETATLVRTSNCVTRAIAGETLIIPLARDTADLESIFTLNAVATRIWELLERPTTPSRLVAAIVQEFDVTSV